MIQRATPQDKAITEALLTSSAKVVHQQTCTGLDGQDVDIWLDDDWLRVTPDGRVLQAPTGGFR